MRSIAFLSLVACSLALGACGSAGPPHDACTESTGQALNVCAAGATVKGIDVSTYQGTIDWTKVKAAGVEFAFARISDGTANPDDQFAANWKGMKAAGVIRGAYQYWRAGVDPSAQAKLVSSSLEGAGGLAAGDLPVVMDIETADGASAATIEANMKVWLAAVKASTGLTPIVYTSEGTYPISATTFDTYTLWVANYGATCPVMPVGWTKWAFWQNSDSGSVAGITDPPDTDLFNGTLAELQALAGQGGAATDGGMGSVSEDGGAVEDGGPKEAADGGAGTSSGGSMGGDAGGAMRAGKGDAGAGAPAPSNGAVPCGS